MIDAPVIINMLVGFVTSFVVSALILPGIIKIFKRKSATQTILGYVEEHKEKNGTPTMGGVVFLVSLLLSFIFLDFDLTWLMCVLVSIFFGILGLMDDMMKIKYKQNLGLRPYQKIIGQLGISLIFAIFIFTSRSGKIFLPLTDKVVNIKFMIIPFVILVLVASTNSVNLTDGLDGLAGNVTLIYLIFFTVISSIVGIKLYNSGETGETITNIVNLGVISMIIVGSILAFLLHNTSRASIFMGDAGSLCLGGYIGASACLIGFEFLLLILGFCFVFSAVSVIIQVLVYKISKKRVFKMAPFHHHLQMSGLSEPRIVAIYSTITAMIGVICIIFYLV